MDEKIKQQIDDWTKADEHQKVIDTLEKIPSHERDYEATGLLARAYNNIEEYETALTLLESTQEEGLQDTNWNFRMGYALYYLDRNKEALSYFTRANELTPGDEDTVYFIYRCNMEMPFRDRVDAFWQWFLQNEAELSRMVEKRGEYEGDAMVEFIAQGTASIAEDVHFNIGGDYEFTFSIEGNSYLFYLYPYLISRMPERLKGKWHFFPFNPGTNNSFGFQMYGVKIGMADVQVAVDYREEQNDFAISFYEKNLCSLPEEQSYNAFYIMMEIMLGEGLSYLYISDVERTDEWAEGMIPLPALRSRITETLNNQGKKVFDNPQEVFVSYRLEPQESEELRYDVITGSTCFSDLVSHYYRNDTDLFDKINRFGAQAVFIVFPYEDNDEDKGSEVLDLRYELEDRIEKEILKPEGLGLLLGGAWGTENCYIDLLLYDVDAFLEKVVPLLSEYPDHSFYLSDFRRQAGLTRLSESADDDC